MSSAGQKVNLAGAYVAYQRDLAKSGSLLPATIEYQSAGRQRQLDTLLHLSHFSDYLVLVTAPVGAGKSTFVQQFLRVQPTDTCVLHLAPTETLTGPRLVREMMAQLPIDVPNHASLEATILAIQDLSAQLVANEQVLLVVVDDAQHLDDEALELLANILPHTSAAESRPHVVLFAEPELVSRLDGEQYRELRQERYYQLSLAAFNQSESREYLQQLVASLELPGDASIHPEQLDQLYHTAGGVPGYLEMLLRNAIRQGGLQQQGSLPIWHLLAIVVVVLGVVGLWWFNRPVDVEQSVAVEAVAAPVLEEAAPANAVDDAEQMVAPVVKSNRQPLPVLQPIALSPQPEYKSLQPEDEVVEPKPVNAESQLVDPQQRQATDVLLAKTQSLQAQLQAAAKEAAQSVAEEPQSVEEPQPVEESMPVVKSKPEVESQSQPEPQLVQTLSISEQAFMALPANHYSLQVLGARYEATAVQFINRLQGIALPNYILKLERGGSDWYVVLLGNFASASAAKDTLDDLPRHVRDLQPWSRQVSKLQQQLEGKTTQ